MEDPGHMGEIQSPQTQAYGRTPTRAERAEARQEQQGTDPAVELAFLRQEMEALKEWRRNLQGKNGINVTGTEITLDHKALRIPQSGEGTISIFCVFNGGLTRVNFNATVG